jgi:hypothetical protein
LCINPAGTGLCGSLGGRGSQLGINKIAYSEEEKQQQKILFHNMIV